MFAIIRDPILDFINTKLTTRVMSGKNKPIRRKSALFQMRNENKIKKRPEVKTINDGKRIVELLTCKRIGDECQTVGKRKAEGQIFRRKDYLKIIRFFVAA